MKRTAPVVEDHRTEQSIARMEVATGVLEQSVAQLREVLAELQVLDRQKPKRRQAK